jgi:GH15 family glucan-1,4-alpha-glucosidase
MGAFLSPVKDTNWAFVDELYFSSGVWTVGKKRLDLFKTHPEVADWNWFYTNGKSNFETIYAPWYDKADGLYKGQNTFQDLQSDGYPVGYSLADCVLLKSTSTNCLYYKAMLSLANAAKKCNLPEESKSWIKKAESLKRAILKELLLPDGTFTYFKDRNGKVLANQHNLGTAFAILFGIVKGEAARKAIQNYPSNQYGTPLIYPYLGDGKGDHNAAAWPFCDTFFLQAKEIADGKDYTGYNAALLARTMGTKFSEKRDKEWV